MGWPVDVKLTPRLYKEIFKDNKKAQKLMFEWARKNLSSNGKQENIEYSLGDLVWFILEEGPHFTKVIGKAEYPAPINISVDEAYEWLDILEDHFRNRQRDKRLIEEVIENALRKQEAIDLDVADNSRWRRPVTEHTGLAGKKANTLRIHSPRRPHRRRKRH